MSVTGDGDATFASDAVAAVFVVAVVDAEAADAPAVVDFATTGLLLTVLVVAVVLDGAVFTERVAVVGTVDFALVTMGLPLLLSAAVFLPRFIMQ